MFNLSIPEFLLTMATCGFILGLIAICIGIFILISKILGKDVREIADQTTKMAQKGIAEDMSGLVGNASTLLSALNELIRTSAGIGVFLVFLGVIFLAGAYWLVMQAASIL